MLLLLLLLPPGISVRAFGMCMRIFGRACMVRALVLCSRALGACTHSVCVLRVRVHLFSSLYSDVFRALKHQTEDIQDDNLRSRAANLPKLLQSRWAATTNRKYNNAWGRWVHWCSLYSASSCPACPFYIALYLNDLVLEGCKISALSAAASGIRWGHVMSGQVNPMDNLFVKTALEGARRTVGKAGSGRQKEPFTTDMAKQVVLAYGHSSSLLHLGCWGSANYWESRLPTWSSHTRVWNSLSHNPKATRSERVTSCP